MAKWPDRLNIDKSDREIYKKLQEEGLFKDLSNMEQFIFAMAVGFKNNIKTSLTTKEGWFFANDLHQKETILLYSIALSVTNNPEILTEIDKIYQMAEEYAHAGILIINDKITSMQFGSFEKSLEKELFEIADEYSREAMAG